MNRGWWGDSPKTPPKNRGCDRRLCCLLRGLHGFRVWRIRANSGRMHWWNLGMLLTFKEKIWSIKCIQNLLYLINHINRPAIIDPTGSSYLQGTGSGCMTRPLKMQKSKPGVAATFPSVTIWGVASWQSSAKLPTKQNKKCYLREQHRWLQPCLHRAIVFLHFSHCFFHLVNHQKSEPAKSCYTDVLALQK